MASAIQDISLPVGPGTAVYPGDPAVKMRRFAAVTEDGFNASELSLSTHAGTHIDAPLHLFDDAPDAASTALGTLMGPARVVSCAGSVHIDVAALEAERSGLDARLLLRTGAGSELRAGGAGWGELTTDAAHWLVDRHVCLVGIESLSVDAPGADDLPVHRILLDAGVVIIEGLDLSGVQAGIHELICLPLRLLGGDAAPARAVLRPLPGLPPQDPGADAL
jgi:arylformamidase